MLWVPMLKNDTRAAAEQQAELWLEDRVRHWWDGTKQVSEVFREALGLQGPAWDLYLLYGEGARWEGAVPPRPAFWMHQLSDPGADSNLFLWRDPERLRRELDALIQE